MGKQTEVPRYATLLYHVLHDLDISINEYFYLDMVQKLSYQRWCTKSLENCAQDMRISKRGLIKLRDRLIERGLLQKNIKGHLKVTAKYIDVAVNKVPQGQHGPVNSVTKSVNKVHRGGELSATKNNNRLTREIEDLNFNTNKLLNSEDHRGKPSPAKEVLRRMVYRRTEETT